jgi:hypothetical protein
MLGRPQLARVLKEMVGPPLAATRPSAAAAPPRGFASLQQPAQLDPVQEALLAEPCILVDRNDRVIGQVTVQVVNNRCFGRCFGTVPFIGFYYLILVA